MGTRLSRYTLVCSFVLVALLSASPAWAGPPDQGHEQGEYEDLVEAGEWCDFPVHIGGWYNVHWRYVWDGAGQLIAVKWQSVTHETLTNMNTGNAIIGQYAGSGSEDLVSLPDGVLAVRTGLTVQFRASKGGVLTRDAGKIVYDMLSWDVFFEAGPHPNFPGGVICDLLSE